MILIDFIWYESDCFNYACIHLFYLCTFYDSEGQVYAGTIRTDNTGGGGRGVNWIDLKKIRRVKTSGEPICADWQRWQAAQSW
jgi:hypothetical protein